MKWEDLQNHVRISEAVRRLGNRRLREVARGAFQPCHLQCMFG